MKTLNWKTMRGTPVKRERASLIYQLHSILCCRGQYVIEIAGQIGLYLPYVIDPINPKMQAMTWTFYDSSAQYVTLLIFNIIRSIPQRIMVAVLFTNVRTV